MGVNIILYKIKSVTLEETCGGKMEPYAVTEKQEWFDSLRCSGDREFAGSNQFKSPVIEGHILDEFCIPEDFNKTRDWIEANIELCNRQRLMEAITEMEMDNTLVFRFSY
jgi:hypothetical protein